MLKRTSDQYYRVAPTNHTDQAQSGWSKLMKPASWGHWNGDHQRLQATESPSISVCTTATNLSSLDFQSNSTISSVRKMNKEDNLRMAIPEIEPLQKKQEDDIIYNPCENKKPTLNQIGTQIIVAVTVSWVSMINGYANAYTSPAQLSLERDFSIGEIEMSWISSFLPLSALAGGLGGGTLIEFLGRKWTIFLTNVLFLISWLTIVFAQDYTYLYAGRIITGLAVGIGSLVLPVYLAETIQPEIRGTLGMLPTALGNVGILQCFLSGMFFEWRVLAFIGAVLSVPFLVAIWFIPDTPRYLVSKGKEEQSRAALRWLRGSEIDIDKEHCELKKIQKDSDEQHESILVLFSRNNLKLLGIVLGLMFFQQFSGINAVIYYTTKIFEESGSTLDKSLCTTVVGIVNFVSTFIAAVLIDKLGRKILLYISSVSMMISLVVLGAYFYLKNETTIDIDAFGWLPLISFMVYVLGFSLGFGPVPWLMMGEILPAKIRGAAASVSTAFNWTCTFIVTKTFLLIIKAIGSHYTFWLFGIIVTLSLFFCILFVPETKGQSLADIETKLSGKKGKVLRVDNSQQPVPI